MSQRYYCPRKQLKIDNLNHKVFKNIDLVADFGGLHRFGVKLVPGLWSPKTRQRNLLAYATSGALFRY